jgi:hypothetical protein
MYKNTQNKSVITNKSYEKYQNTSNPKTFIFFDGNSKMITHCSDEYENVKETTMNLP